MPSTPVSTRTARRVCFDGAKQLLPSEYLTDGRRLFRVICKFDPGDDNVLAALEDSATLDGAPYSTHELVAMRLRPVRGAVAGTVS